MGGYEAAAIPDERQMQNMGAAALDGPLSLLMGAQPDVVIYGCTSATLTHGPAFDQALAAKISAQSGCKTVTAAGAVLHALDALGVKRIGFASPYVRAINDLAIECLSSRGFETVAQAEIDDALDNEGQGALTPQAVYELAVAADHPLAEAIVLSCTDMRSVEAIDRVEQSLGKPVVTSSQAIAFQALDLAGQPTVRHGFGALLGGA